MNLQVGSYFRVETKPSPGQSEDDTPFGTVVWEVTEIGLECPEPYRKNDAAGKPLPQDQIPMDGVRCTMVGGSGDSARAGYTCMDSLVAIAKNIKDGICVILPPDQAKKLSALLQKNEVASGGKIQAGSAGCMEVD